MDLKPTTPPLEIDDELLEEQEYKKKKKKKSKNKEKPMKRQMIKTKTKYTFDDMDEKLDMLDIVLNLVMDVGNKITSLEEVHMINPFTKKSHRMARSIADSYEFSGGKGVYPESVTQKLDDQQTTAVKLPKVIFIPDKSVMRQIILGTLKFA